MFYSLGENILLCHYENWVFYGKNIPKNLDCPGSLTEVIYLYPVHEMVYDIHENVHLRPYICKPCFVMDQHEWKSETPSI